MDPSRNPEGNRYREPVSGAVGAEAGVPGVPEGRTIRSRLEIFVVVAAVASAAMGLELVQSRVLSSLYYNHVVYLTVTIAMMGFGISGVLVSLSARRIQSADGLLTVLVAGFATSQFICLHLASHIPGILPLSSTLVKLTVSYLILVIPFMFAGSALGLVFMTHGRDIFRLYFIDLAASAAAAGAFTLLLWPMGADGFIWLCAGVALMAFLLFATASGVSRKTVVILAAPFVVGLIVLGPKLIGDRPDWYKSLGRIFLPHWGGTATIEETHWTPITRVDVLFDPVRDLMHGEPIPDAQDQRMVTQDGSAVTMMWGPGRVERAMERGRQRFAEGAIPITYLMRGAVERALVIGVGGGLDIVEARAFGAKHISAVEINPATVQVAQGRLADFAVWPRWENVQLHVAEGRHFVRSTRERFDTVVMSGIDTFAALNSGAYVLAENYLYTVEAMEDYLKVLDQDGIMTIFRWLFTEPRESLRLANMFVRAASGQGVASPEKHIMVIAQEMGWPVKMAATMIKNRPFTREEVRIALDQVAKSDLLSVVYLPKVFDAGEQTSLEQAAFTREARLLAPARLAYGTLLGLRTEDERRAFVAAYPYRIDPVHDDRPFFFEYYKNLGLLTALTGDLEEIRGSVVNLTLYILFAVTLAVAFLAMIVPLLAFAREGLRVRGLWSLLFYFTSLGVGFMLVEIGMMQRLTLYLGHPMYSLAVVLSGLLVFAGGGSYLAGRLGWPLRRLFALGMLGTGIAVPVWVVVTAWGLPLTAAWPIALRVGVALSSLLAVGLLMGIPFASGLRYLESEHPRFIPWAWGINGITSVMASILAIILAMRFGFVAVVAIGGLVYLAGFIAIRWHLATGWRG